MFSERSTKFRVALVIILALVLLTLLAGSPETRGLIRSQFASNNVIRWCKPTGQEVVYTNKNQESAGYRPCGALSVSGSCDEHGNRYFLHESEGTPQTADCPHRFSFHFPKLWTEESTSSAAPTVAKPVKKERENKEAGPALPFPLPEKFEAVLKILAELQHGSKL